MDCQMPELNGFEATAAIRSGPASETPIIAMTDPSTFDDLQSLDEMRKYDFLVRVVQQFEHKTSELFGELRAAFASADAAAVARIAHQIDGSGGRLGGRRLASSCAALVRKANAGAISGADREIEQVEAAGSAELRQTWSKRLDDQLAAVALSHV